MKTQMLNLLNLSLVPDSTDLKQATSQLSALSKQPGYCLTAMQVADDQNQPIPIRQAALIQFKNISKRYWSSLQFQISQQEKSVIINALIPAFIRCSNNYPLLKLYKEIFCNIIGEVHKSWIPTQIICANLNQNQNSIPILHIIIAISSNFQMTLESGNREQFYKFLKSIFPILKQFVQKNNNQQIIYLITKIIWKSVHFQISNELRTIICQWMDFIITIAAATNQQLQSKVQQFQNRGTVQFYYFHAKKWATRILFRFISRHASSTFNIFSQSKTKQLDKQFSTTWYQRYGQSIIQTITKQFLIPTIKKTRCFQLQCLKQLVNAQPSVMKQFAQYFQYQILPPYLQLQPEDQQIANKDPIQFINRQDTFNPSNTYLKTPAMQAWLAFSKIGKKKKKKNDVQQVSQLFNSNMKYLKQKLQGNNPLEKQMAMYIICNFKLDLHSSNQVKQILPTLISNCIIPWFTSDIMFLRARAMQIFDQYGHLGFDKSVIKKAVQGIYLCLSQDNYPLVRLKAASAFHALLQHPQARQQVKPLFKQILHIYLILMDKYDSQMLVLSLQGIINHFSSQVGPYAYDLMKHICKHFVKMLTKQKQKPMDFDDDGQTQLAASAVLKIMCILIQSPIDKQIIIRMQPDILDICDYVLCVCNADYIQQIIDLLRVYTHRVPAVSQRLLFYYVILIYYLIGIDSKYWQLIQKLNLPDINKKGLLAVKMCSNTQNLTQIVYVLRNYISHALPLLIKLNDPFGINLLQLLFKMVDVIYQSGPNNYQGQIQLINCTILMVYLLQNNHKKWDEQTINHIWIVSQHNLMKAKSNILKATNAQLLCLLLWNYPQKTIALSQASNLLSAMITCILNSQHQITMQHERQRLILGISQLMIFSNKPQQLTTKLPELFQYSVKLVNKNCEIRLEQNIEQDEQQSESESFDDDDINQLKGLTNQQPQDIWFEDYQRNYTSPLDQIDQIKYFKSCIQKLQFQQFNLYNQLIANYPANQLSLLDSNITKALALTQS